MSPSNSLPFSASSSQPPSHPPPSALPFPRLCLLGPFKKHTECATIIPTVTTTCKNFLRTIFLSRKVTLVVLLLKQPKLVCLSEECLSPARPLWTPRARPNDSRRPRTHNGRKFIPHPHIPSLFPNQL